MSTNINNKTGIIAGTVLVLIAIIIGLIASSLKKLSSEEAGLQYDVHQRTLKDRVYLACLYPGPPGFKFLIFPRVYQTISFANKKCLNKDGLEVALSVQFQYLASVTDANLKRLVMEFKDHDTYKDVVVDTAEGVIHDICSLFNVTEFQTSRNQFQESILATLHTRLTSDLSTSVRDVQVSNIQRPHEYEVVVRDKESARQNIKVAEQERPRILTAASTKLLESETQANITLNKAHTDARITVTKAGSEGEAILNACMTEAQTYKQIMVKQNLTIDGLLSYLTIRAVQSPSRGIHINLGAPARTNLP